MKCPFCNQDHPDGTKFRPETGNKIELSSLTCPSCGLHDIPNDSKFCPNCGTKLQGGPFPPPEDNNDDIKTFNVKGISFDMVKVKAGTFIMGDSTEIDNPEHKVTITHDYYIGKYPVTNELFLVIYKEVANWEGLDWDENDFPSEVLDNPEFPATELSYDDVRDVIRALRKLTNFKFDLPTEAEWEYAARGGEKSEDFMYSGSDDLEDVAWQEDNSDGVLHDVGELEPNELGIHDMSGLVREWCHDWFDSDYYDNSPSNNPRGPRQGDSKVIRGGSFNTDEEECDICYRDFESPDSSLDDVGFRLVLRIK